MGRKHSDIVCGSGEEEFHHKMKGKQPFVCSMSTKIGKKDEKKRKKLLTKVDSGNVLVFFFPFVIKLSCCWLLGKSPVFLLLFSSHIKAAYVVRKWGGSFFFCLFILSFSVFCIFTIGKHKMRRKKSASSRRIEQWKLSHMHGADVRGRSTIGSESNRQTESANAQHNGKEMEKRYTKAAVENKSKQWGKTSGFSLAFLLSSVVDSNSQHNRLAQALSIKRMLFCCVILLAKLENFP